MTTLLSASQLELVGWMLLHSLWQFSVIGMAVAAVLSFLPSRRSDMRYLVACSGLLATVLSAAATLGIAARQTHPTRAGAELTGPAPTLVREHDEVEHAAVGADDRVDLPIAETVLIPPASRPPNPDRAVATVDAGVLSDRVSTWLPILALCWILGVSALSVWNLGGWIGVRRLAAKGRHFPGEEVAARLRDLAPRMRIRRAVQAFKSTLVEVPVVVGWLEPVILLPACLLAEMTPAQLHAVLAHELAHIRRHDYLVNLVQSVLSMLFFYHPAVWWISRQVCAEREHCCDDMAVRVCGSKIELSEALTMVAAARARSSLVMAASGPASSALRRVRRLLDPSAANDELMKPSVWAGVLVLSSVTVAALLNLRPMLVAQETPLASSAQGETEPPQQQALDHFRDALPEGAALRLGTIRFRQHQEVKAIAFAPDGESFATTDTGTVIIWDTDSGLPRTRLQNGDADAGPHVTAIGYSPSGTELATYSAGAVSIWDAATGVKLISLKVPTDGRPFGRGNNSLAYSPDGLKIAITNGLSVTVLDTASGAPPESLSLPGHRAGLNGLVWSSDGRYLVSATLAPQVVAWDVISGEVERKFEGRGGAYGYSVALSADSSVLAATTVGQPTVTIWDFKTGKELKQLDAGDNTPHSLAISADGQLLVAGREDGRIRVLDLESGEILHDIDGELWIGRSLAVDKEFSTVALGAVYPTIRMWDLATGAEKFPRETTYGHNGPLHCAVYSPDGKWIATGGPNGQLHLWNALTGEHRVRLPTKSSVGQLAFDREGEHLFAAWNNSDVVRVWNIESATEVQAFELGQKRARVFDLSTDGRTLVVVGSDSRYGWHSTPGEDTIHVWDVDSGMRLRQFNFTTASTESVLQLAGRGLVVTGAANGEIHVMDVTTGKNRQLLLAHRHSVDALRATPNGKWLISGSTDQTIRVWDTEDWQPIKVLEGHTRAVTSLAVSPDGRMLASGSGKKSNPLESPHSHRIRLWNLSTGEQIGFLSGHASNTSAVAFSPDGRRLVSAHDNTTALVWNLPGESNE